MKNITLAMEDDVLEGMRQYAARHRTTVNALIRDHCKRIVTQEDRAAQARQELVELSRKSTARLGPDWKWNREELYDRDALHRHERLGVRGGRKTGSKE
jgi:hypothetical protein